MRPVFLLIAITFASLASAAPYTVPVPAELYPHARFDAHDVKISLEKGLLEVSYCLPTELVGGTAPTFQFTGEIKGNFVEVSGDHVDGVCMVAKDKPVTCMLKYPGLRIDTESRDAALTAKFKGEELVARKEVARLFGNDPAGILSTMVK